MRWPYADAAKAVIEAAAAEADTMGDAQVSELHLLLALSTIEGEGGVLRHFGFDASAARGAAGQAGTV
jgi:Clp amino terminal domain, pathogenicity island component